MCIHTYMCEHSEYPKHSEYTHVANYVCPLQTSTIQILTMSKPISQPNHYPLTQFESVYHHVLRFHGQT